MKEQIVIKNLLVNYYRFKKEGKKTILFLHGWRSEGLVWKQIAEIMENEDIAMYAVDLPGFGLSAIPKKALSVQDYSDVIFEFIKKLGLKNLIIVGHSFGGRISIKLAAAHPGLAEKIVLVDSAGLILRGQKNKAKSIIAKTLKPLFKPKFMQGIRAKIYKGIGSEDYVATPYLKETFLKTINEDLRCHLPEIVSPALIIWGDKDKETPLEFAEIMNKEIKNSRKVVFEGAGHYSFLDDPSLFQKELVNFINEK